MAASRTGRAAGRAAAHPALALQRAVGNRATGDLLREPDADGWSVGPPLAGALARGAASSPVPARASGRAVHRQEVSGAAGESPVRPADYVHEPGCSVDDVSNLIDDPAVRSAMIDAIERSRWNDFLLKREVSYTILQASDCSIVPRLQAEGAPNRGFVGFDLAPDGRRDGMLVVGDIHTHFGRPDDGYVPGPSPRDRRNMTEHPESLGNEAYVLDSSYIYVVYRDGGWRTLGPTADLLGLSRERAIELGVDVTPAGGRPGRGELTYCVRATDLAGLDATFARGEITVVEFGASWCRPCHALLDQLEAICEDRSDDAGRLFFRKIDIDDVADADSRFSLGPSIPVLIFFRGDTELERISSFHGDWPAQGRAIDARIGRLLSGEPEPRRNLLVLDVGTALSGPAALVLRPAYRRVVASWLDERLQLGLDLGARLTLTEGDAEGTPAIPGGTRFSVEPGLNVAYSFTGARPGAFIEAGLSFAVGQVVPEETAVRFGGVARGGVGYDFGGGRIGIYTDVVLSESRRFPALGSIFLGGGGSW